MNRADKLVAEACGLTADWCEDKPVNPERVKTLLKELLNCPAKGFFLP